MSVKEQILSELSNLESAIMKLQLDSGASKSQTDLENAILKKQNKDAIAKIDSALQILEKLK